MVTLKGKFTSSQYFIAETGEKYFLIPTIGMNSPPVDKELYVLFDKHTILSWVEGEGEDG